MFGAPTVVTVAGRPSDTEPSRGQTLNTPGYSNSVGRLAVMRPGAVRTANCPTLLVNKHMQIGAEKVYRHPNSSDTARAGFPDDDEEGHAEILEDQLTPTPIQSRSTQCSQSQSRKSSESSESTMSDTASDDVASVDDDGADSDTEEVPAAALPSSASDRDEHLPSGKRANSLVPMEESNTSTSTSASTSTLPEVAGGEPACCLGLSSTTEDVFVLPEELGEPACRLDGVIEEPAYQLGSPVGLGAGEPAYQLGAPIEEPAYQLGAPIEEPTYQLGAPIEEPAYQLGAPIEEPAYQLGAPIEEPAYQMGAPIEEPAYQLGAPIEEPAYQLGAPIEEPAYQLGAPIEEPAYQLGSPVPVDTDLGEPAFQLGSPIFYQGEPAFQLGSPVPIDSQGASSSGSGVSSSSGYSGPCKPSWDEAEAEACAREMEEDVYRTMFIDDWQMEVIQDPEEDRRLRAEALDAKEKQVRRLASAIHSRQEKKTIRKDVLQHYLKVLTELEVELEELRASMV